MTTRRYRHSALAAILALTMLLAACGSGSSSTSSAKKFEGKVFRVATWGGDWGNNTKKAVGDRFEQQTGAKVEYVFGNPADNVTKLLASRGKPPFDVIQTDPTTQQQLIDQGMLEKLDRSKFPVFKDLYPEALVTKDYGPAFAIVPTVIAWNVDKWKETGLPEPTSIDDLMNPKLKGRVAFPSIKVGFTTLILAGLANGWSGDQSKVPDAITKLKGGDFKVYGATPEMTTWISNGDVVAAVTHLAQAGVLKNAGGNIKWAFPKAGNKTGMVYWNFIDIVKGTENRELADIWVNLQLGVDGQVDFGKYQFSVPTSTKAAAELKKEEKFAPLAIDPKVMNSMYSVDWKYLLANRDKWVDSWNNILGK